MGWESGQVVRFSGSTPASGSRWPTAPLGGGTLITAGEAAGEAAGACVAAGAAWGELAGRLTTGFGAGEAAAVGPLGRIGSRSQENRSEFGRVWRPSGPFTHVVLPSVKAVMLSTLRHTSKPPDVRCSVFP